MPPMMLINNPRRLNSGASLSIVLFSFLAAVIFWLCGFHQSWLVLFIWIPPLITLRHIVLKIGAFASFFDAFAILCLAYIYMLSDYIVASFQSLIGVRGTFSPVSGYFFVSLFLGSL